MFTPFWEHYFDVHTILGALFRLQFWASILGVFRLHFWASILGVFRLHFWASILGTLFRLQFWASILGTLFRLQFWASILGALFDLNCLKCDFTSETKKLFHIIFNKLKFQLDGL